MKKEEIYAKLIVGGKIEKQEYMTFKRGKLVRGTNYIYQLDGERITEKQFEAVYDKLKRVGSDYLSVKVYMLTEFLDNQPF